MAAAKKKAVVEPEPDPVAVILPQVPAAPLVKPAGGDSAPGRKIPTKEPIAFLWKLVGYSGGVPLTLLKCVERGDADTQLERYREEGYYTDLAIHPIATKIPLPKDLSPLPGRPDDRAKTGAGFGDASTRKKGASDSTTTKSSKKAAPAEPKSPKPILKKAPPPKPIPEMAKVGKSMKPAKTKKKVATKKGG